MEHISEVFKYSHAYKQLSKRQEENEIKITLSKIKNIVTDIKNDDEWVNDSYSAYEHKGICDGLDRLVKHIIEIN
tara:strand:- start:2596 stop:2820 length:225 start_codon:yes stop_codon:yes gene_type:complete